MKKSINHNYYWAETVVQSLIASGVKHVVIAPGSRSTSLVIAVSKSKLKSYIHFDERACGFFALGLAKASKEPIAIITTSGTAVAELYPSIIEAYYSRTPLIVCTADRPEYYQNTGANQTINQYDIFRNHIRFFVDVGLPNLATNEISTLISTIKNAVLTSHNLDAGPVHINLPFEKPFEPSTATLFISQEKFLAMEKQRKKYLNSPLHISNDKSSLKPLQTHLLELESKIFSIDDGLVLCGGNEFPISLLKKIVQFSENIGFPLYADAASGLHFISDSRYLITNILLIKDNNPKLIIQFGTAPILQSDLTFIQDSTAEKIQINAMGDLHDPSRTMDVFKIDEGMFLSHFKHKKIIRKHSSWLKEIVNKQMETENKKQTFLQAQTFDFEPKSLIEILKCLPNKTNLFVANSTPIRDMGWFASARKKDISLYVNRGASGIDGIIATALGIASQSKKHTSLITGDTTFLYDLTSLYIGKKYNISFVVFLINNQGGGIFDNLPIVKYHKPIKIKYFNNPIFIDFEKCVALFNCSYKLVKSEKELFVASQKAFATNGISIIEIKTNSEQSAKLRKEFFDECAN